MFELVRFSSGKQKAAELINETAVDNLEGIGETSELSIIPLIDWYTGNDSLKGEAGLSYLIKTDRNTILFDVGFDYPAQGNKTALQHNMDQLGISLDEIDTIVISHAHPDHVGGRKWQRAHSFSPARTQIHLGNKVVYSPIKMTYPGLTPVQLDGPFVIAPGVASIGPIPAQLFLMGWVQEQALAVNVAGKGIVLIVGCGHQGLKNILARTEALFDEPLYGIVGGLHYPVTASRIAPFGLHVQKRFATGKLPWKPITADEVAENIDFLQRYNPRLVALSAHDSCDASIGQFREAFPEAYCDVKVGSPITVA